MKYFVVKGWNGRAHFSKTDLPPGRSHNPQLSEETERFTLTEVQSRMSCDTLEMLYRRGDVLTPYVPPPSLQNPACFTALGIVPGATIAQINDARDRAVADLKGEARPHMRNRIRRAHKHCLRLSSAKV